MLEKLLRPSIITYHHAQSGGLPAERHNAYEHELALEEKDLKALKYRNPAFVEGYSEEDIEESIGYMKLHIPNIINLVIESNNGLPVEDQDDHTDLKALREGLVQR